jgi:hypothetical protein
MKFKDLVDKYAWDDAQVVLLQLYPDEEKSLAGYRQVYETLRSLQPAETKLRICIESVTSDLDGETYEDVSGKDGRTRREASPEVDWDGESGNKEESFGIEFTDWAEWLGMEIDPQTADRYPELAIIGHCLWEMTFVGYTREAVREKSEELRATAERVKEGKDGVKCYSAEDIERLLEEVDEDATSQDAERDL